MKQRILLSMLVGWMLSAALIAGQASAHYIYETERVYSSDDDIGYERVDVYSKGHFTFDCAGTIWKSVNEIKAAADFYYESGGDFYVCHYSSWSYNSSPGTTHAFAIDWIGASPQCGATEYKTLGWGYVQQDGGPYWLGGGAYSGSTGHDLPA
jgi:hypothetical protein